VISYTCLKNVGIRVRSSHAVLHTEWLHDSSAFQASAPLVLIPPLAIPLLLCHLVFHENLTGP